MNPFFALSAMFALGLRGIRLKLALPFPPLGHEGVTPDTLPRLATSLDAATSAFAHRKSVAREVFGDEFVDHFAGTRREEWKAWEKAVTNWEVERYVELA